MILSISSIRVRVGYLLLVVVLVNILVACQNDPLGIPTTEPISVLPTYDTGQNVPHPTASLIRKIDPKRSATPPRAITATLANPPTTSAPIDPTTDTRDVPVLCSDLDKAWGNDWPTVIDILGKIRGQSGRCGDKEPAAMLYPAYYNYGVWLDTHGNQSSAIDAYQKALSFNAQGTEAALALQRLNSFTPVPPLSCTDQQTHDMVAAIPPYVVQGKGPFVQLQGNALTLNNQPYKIRGVNYYPVRAPWRRFLTESDPIVMAKEMDLIKSAGLNTMRIFLWYDALFDCPGNGAIPKIATVVRLDAVIKLAAERNLRLIVTLNDLPDLTMRPLYTFPDLAAAQTNYIVSRYKDEPMILAWDLRNEGDIDYTRANQSATNVLKWLTQTSTQVRQIDPNHLITAGWLSNAAVTDSAVDFLSFHHWTNEAQMRTRLAAFRANSQKPILLEEFGYSTLGVSEEQQSTALHSVLTSAESNGLLGWLIWSAFDFPPDVTCIPPACPDQDNGQLHYGIWHTDYSPKSAVDMLKAHNNQ